MKIVAKFTTSDGKVTTATFDRATGTVVSDDGRKGTYKREGNTLKISGDQSFTLAQLESKELAQTCQVSCGEPEVSD
jgi:hypothetical protein